MRYVLRQIAKAGDRVQIDRNTPGEEFYLKSGCYGVLEKSTMNVRWANGVVDFSVGYMFISSDIYALIQET